jgi:transcriptional regulator with XRE-family HTH domain
VEAPDTWQLGSFDHAGCMGSKERAADRGTRLGRRLIATSGTDLRLARVSAGLSLEQVGQALGMSHSQLGRIERAMHPSVSVMQLARIASVVGLDLSVRTYPNGSPLRDKAQLALIQRFRERLATKLTVRTEVALMIAGDLRAWDMVVYGAGEPIGVEAETRLVDLQALERKITLKMRDGGLSRVVLLVAATRGNKTAVRHAMDAIRASYPIEGRTALRLLVDGQDPGGSALILL